MAGIAGCKRKKREIVSSSSSCGNRKEKVKSSGGNGNQKEKIKRQKRKNRRKDLCKHCRSEKPSSRLSHGSFRSFRSANIVDLKRKYRDKIAAELARLKMQGSFRVWEWFEKVIDAWNIELEDAGFMRAEVFFHSNDGLKKKITKDLVKKHADRLK